jgi:hypothetical protein
MSLNQGTVNELSVLELRKLPFVPKHFVHIDIHKIIDLYTIHYLDFWINYNLNGRYGIQKVTKLDDNNKIIICQRIGFENPTDLLMFTLGCGDLLQNKIL